MPTRTRLATALTLLALLATLATLSAATQAPDSPARTAQPDGIAALDGEWLYVEDRTEGRAPEQQQPSMSTKFALRVEKDAVILIRGSGSQRREIRMPLDGSPTEVPGQTKATMSRYSGQWKDGAFAYEIEQLRVSEESTTLTGMIRIELRPTPDGGEGGKSSLLAKVEVGPPTEMKSIALYRHPQDIPLPTPAKAKMEDVTWLAGAWTGTRGAAGATSIEERWSPPLGGSMLATSRTVSRNRMVAFEFLRITERDGGLIYIAQPNGSPPTEFVLTELTKTRAVFENPRHDSPQRIVYELAAEKEGESGTLTASIGFIKGGRPQRFEFKREAAKP